MSRLIDADKLIERMKEDTSEAKKKIPQFEYVDKEVWQRVIEIIESYIDIIKEQPTAYDVDKVVSKMETEIEENQDASLSEYRAGLYKAIEVVKAGGIDD